MAISTRAMLRPRLSSLGEAAATVLLGRATTSSSSSLSSSTRGQKRMAIAALHTAAFVRHYNPSTAARAELGKMVALHGTCIANTASLSFHGSLQLFGSRYYASSSTKFGRKASLKRGLISKRAVERKSLGPGKAQKQGRTSKRSVSVLASSRQRVASSMGERQKMASSMGERRSERHLASPEKSSFVKTISKTAFRRQEKSEEGYNSRDGTHPRDVGKKTQGRRPVTRPAEGSFPSKDSRTVKKALWNQGKKQGGADLKASTQARDVGSQKKGKRVMRLDPQDKTSKRLFEGYPLPGEEVSQEQSVEPTTSRGQFRAITPPPKLMQHIERHMLGRRRPSELQRAGYDMKITPAPLDNIPYSKKGERQPIQEEVFRHKLRFAAAAKIVSSFPPADIPEVAFAGRSNVGKSSLINALTRHWGVARTSDKPGLTQSINFFRLGGRLCLVDLPGYGFAYAKEEKKESWEELVREFLTTRVGLKRVCLLVDAKWGLKLRDEELIELMEKAGTKYQIVLTKSDTVTPIDLARRATQIQEVFKENKSLILPMIMVSSKTGEGLEFFRANVAKLAKASLI